MRGPVLIASLLLSGCVQAQRHTTLCDFEDGLAKAAGAHVRFDAMLMEGNMEYRPSVLDSRCGIGIPADLQTAPESLKQAFASPGSFNKFATVSGRIEVTDGKVLLRVTDAEQVRVRPPMSKAEEALLFQRMVRQRNEYFAAHRSRAR